VISESTLFQRHGRRGRCVPGAVHAAGGIREPLRSARIVAHATGADGDVIGHSDPEDLRPIDRALESW